MVDIPPDERIKVKPGYYAGFHWLNRNTVPPLSLTDNGVYEDGVTVLARDYGKSKNNLFDHDLDAGIVVNGAGYSSGRYTYSFFPGVLQREFPIESKYW